jgi:BirA family transcriptional regulator, biotin operon repressor / biotin---[acetyl-CoA-carboxylase] ligase
MLSVTDLERALEGLGLEAPVRFDEVTGSTNATALAMAEAGTPEWTLVAAGHQTAGRGRLGRSWTDRAEAALMCSFVVRPSFEPEHGGLIPLLAGVAMAAAIRDVADLDVRCKWPNDLLIEGSKIGGILVESSVADGRIVHAVVGVGVNLEAPSGVDGASGIGDVDPAALLTSFLRGFHDGYARLPVGTVESWSEVSATIGHLVEVMRWDGPSIRGRAVAVDEHGALVIETEEGTQTVTSGEVEHLSGG